MRRLLLPLILILVAAGAYFFIPSGEKETENNPPSLPETEILDSSAADPEPDPEDEIRQQRLSEHARPQDHIVLVYEVRKNLLGETILEGTMRNDAMLTVYQDPRLMVYFEDENGTAVDSASQVVFSVLEKGAEVPFRLKEKGPKKTNPVVQVADARVVPEK